MFLQISQRLKHWESGLFEWYHARFLHMCLWFNSQHNVSRYNHMNNVSTGISDPKASKGSFVRRIPCSLFTHVFITQFTAQSFYIYLHKQCFYRNLEFWNIEGLGRLSSTVVQVKCPTSWNLPVGHVTHKLSERRFGVQLSAWPKVSGVRITPCSPTTLILQCSALKEIL